MQTADGDRLYEPVKMENGKVYLVDTEGKLVKGQTVTDGAGQEWAMDEYGNVTRYPSAVQPKTAVGPKTLVWDK